MAVDDKVLERIKKLLALAGENGFTNDNENEAKAAFRKAAELMEAHGLAIADINKETGKVSGIDQFSIRQGQAKYRIWANPLAGILAKCFDCRVILVEENQVVVGVKSDIELFTWYYNFLKIRIARNASTKFRLVADQKTYGTGCVAALRTRLLDMFTKVREEVRTEQTKALVVVKKQEVDKTFKKWFPHTKKHSPKRKLTGSSEAYNAGVRDGQTMALNKSIGGGSTAHLQ